MSRRTYIIATIAGLCAMSASARTISSLAPNATTAGAPAFTLSISGTQFALSDRVQWNGQDLMPAYVSDSLLTAAVPATLIAQPGRVVITVVGSDTATASLTVNPPLAISSNKLPQATAGTTLTQTLAATGGTPPIAWFMPDTSSGFSVSPTGVLSGTPLFPGTYTFAVVATDSAGATTTQSYSVLAADAGSFVITSPSPLPADGVGAPYNRTLRATGGGSQLTWGATSGALPPGLTISTNGVITGSPTVAGTYTFVATASGGGGGGTCVPLPPNYTCPGGGGSTSKTMSLKITPQPVSISTASLAGGTVGFSYSAPVVAAGGASPYSWVISAGSLPPGLSLDPAAGTISGAPLLGGSSNVTVTVTDSGQETASKQFLLAVAAPPQILAAAPPDGAIGNSYSLQFSATGGTKPYAWSLRSGTTPGGLSLDPASGMLSGTPTAAGSFRFAVQARDAAGATASRPFTILVNASGIVFITTSLNRGIAGQDYQSLVTASGGKPPYRYSVSTGSLPNGLIFDPAMGTVSGRTSNSIVTTLTLRAEDSVQASANRDFDLVIDPANGTAGQPYSWTFTASPCNLTSGALPDGIALGRGGCSVRGTPTTPGMYSFVLQPVDGSTRLAHNLTITPRLAITTSSLADARLGDAYSASFAATGGTPPYRWRIAGGALPAGLNFDPSNATISGSPTAAGAATFTLEVADGNGVLNIATQQDFTLNVRVPPISTPTLSGPPSTVTPTQQPRVSLSLGAAYPIDITGRLTLAFAPDAVNPANDGGIQFSSGGNAVDFTIPANTTQAVFPVSSLAMQVGTVARDAN
jgi:hypothetical protein